MQHSTDTVQAAMRPMVLWLAPKQPIERRTAYTILARGSGAYRHEAKWAFYTLVDQGFLREDHHAHMLITPDRDTILAITPPSVDPRVLEHQRRIVRDVWLQTLGFRHVHGDAVELAHLLCFYQQAQRCSANRRVTKPDLRLRLYTAELCAALGDTSQATRQLALLASEHASAPKYWEPVFHSHVRYCEALLAIHEQQWNTAKSSLVKAFDIWLDAHPAAMRQELISRFRAEVAIMDRVQLEAYLGFAWNTVFMNRMLATTPQSPFQDRLSVFLKTGEMPPEPPLPSGMTAEEVARMVHDRLSRTPYPIILAFVLREVAHRRLPSLSHWQQEYRGDPEAVEQWYQQTFSDDHIMAARYTINAKDLRPALRFIDFLSDPIEESQDLLYIAGGAEELPYLYLQKGHVVTRVFGAMTGQSAWGAWVPFEAFTTQASHLRHPFTLAYDGAGKHIAVATTSTHRTIDILTSPSHPPEPRWTYPTYDMLLGWIRESPQAMIAALSSEVDHLWWHLNDSTNQKAILQQIQTVLATPCHVIFTPGNNGSDGQVFFRVREKTWHFAAKVFTAWRGTMPLEFVLWLASEPLTRDCNWYRISPTTLYLADVTNEHVVMVPFTQESVAF